jgi:hypothetical protein
VDRELLGPLRPDEHARLKKNKNSQKKAPSKEKKRKIGWGEKKESALKKKETEKNHTKRKKKEMAAATSFGIPLGSEYTFSEIAGSSTSIDTGDGILNSESYGTRPVSSVGGFGLSSLIVSSRSGVVVGAQSTAGGASVTVNAESGGPFLIAATFDPTKAHVPVLFGDVYVRVESGAVTAYAADGPRASIPVDGDEVFVAFCDFGNGARPGALVVRTKTTMSIQRAEPTRCTVPRGPFLVPIEAGTDAWLFYGTSDAIESDAAAIQSTVLSEVATLAAREAAMGARPSSLDRSMFGLMDTGASLYGAAAVVEPSFYTAPTTTGYGSGSGGYYHSRSGYGSGSGSGASAVWQQQQQRQGQASAASSSSGTWPRVWSSRESQF